MNVQHHFEGAWLNSPTYSPKYQAAYGAYQVPYFGGATGDLWLADGDMILDQLIAMGDTHVMALLETGCPGYNENGQPYGCDQIVPSYDFWHDLPTYGKFLDAIIHKGAKPIIAISGEGQNGYAWIKANLQSVVDYLQTGWSYDLLAYGSLEIVFDGVWPASWSVAQMQEMIPWVRSVCGNDAVVQWWFNNYPNPYLYVVAENDYSQPWMDGLDGVVTTTGPSEADCPSLANKAQYMMRNPNYAGCPRAFDGPFILQDCSRGPRVWRMGEWMTRQTVFDPTQSTKPAIDAARARMQALGMQAWG